MSSMNKGKVSRIRTVCVNDRGQIVIPEDIRKEADVSEALDKDNDLFWKAVAKDSLKRAWSEEDDVWDEIARA
ncbi:hypothetical protein HYV82_06325 [Candidatus Woesearchaeota archaeon]|nr:hypothetical protein [Candidatus Woesearchaeota archaeon]